MKFGTYFAYWEQEWEGDYCAYCEKVAGLGFDILEVGAASLPDMSDRELQELREAAEKHKVTLTACIGLPEEKDVASLDEETRRAGIAYMKEIFEAMEKAGIRLLGGIVYACWPFDYSKPVDKPAVRAKSIESMRLLADEAAKKGITLALEVVNRFEHFLLNSAEEAVAFVQEIGKENVKILLDCFHMNIEEDSLGDAIRSAGPWLGHFHIGECNRKVPGKGHMPWKEIGQALRDIGYDGSVVMEPFVRPGGTVGSNIKVWRDLSENADDKKLDEDIREALVFVRREFTQIG